ncbi:hypothetical protein JW960_18075 [candidate division KSB1 bacterium]|nr:hypothetical protein [candidate division KSB1 bacterium]
MITVPIRFGISILFLSLLLISRCDMNWLTGTNLKGIEVTASDNSITITNNYFTTIHFFLVEQETAGRISWAAGCDGNPEHQIQPLKEKYILYDDIYGYEQDCVVICYWWVCTGDNGTVANHVNAVVVKTQ